MQNSIMRPDRNLLFRLSLVVFALVLAGCSAIRLGYANGDTVTYWWMNSYVDFTDEQKPMVRSHIDKLLAWHRRTQLHDYAQFLGHMQQRVQSNQVKRVDVQADLDAIKKRAVLVFEKAVPELTELAMTIQPEQIAHLEKKFASNNEKYRKENLTGSVEDRQAERFKKVMKQAEYWYGDFSKEQKAQIRAASEARPLNNELWLAERVRRQQEMIRMLRKIHAEKPSREAVSAMVRDYIARSADNFTYAENKAFFEASRDGLAQVITVIMNIATPAQREHAVKRLQKWIDDSQALASR